MKTIIFLYLFLFLDFLVKLDNKLSAKYYQRNKKILQKKTQDKDIKIFPRKKKQERGCNRYKNDSETEKQRLIEYRKK